MSSEHKSQSIIWKILMANKFIVAKYIQENDKDGFYNEMVSDKRTVNLLEKDNTATPLFENTEEALKELEYLTDVGYLVKKDAEIIRIKYQYVLYSS
jgi:phosphosulfolactate phosphohydrolase-like enzyme